MGAWQRWSQGFDDAATAVVHHGRHTTYGALVESVRRAAGWLHSLGLRRGDVVALQASRAPSFLEVHLAALATGMVTLPLNDRYTASELALLLEDAAAKGGVLQAGPTNGSWIAADALDDALRRSRPVDLPSRIDDASPAALVYTSGTTGRPKGVPIRHSNLIAMVEALHHAWAWQRSDVLLHTLPLFHIHGLFVAAHGALRAGATLVLEDRFDPEGTAAAMHAHGATVFMGVPTYHHRLLQHELTLPSTLRLITSGSAPLPAQVHEAMRARHGQAIVERYGMTEIGIVLSNPYRGERRPGTVGLPLPGVRIRVVDDRGATVPPGTIGQLLVKGPSVFSGYLGRPDATARALVDGEMHTGDLASMSLDGYVTLHGRSDDLILTGGFNVYPPEVEAVLAGFDGVREVAVVGTPDDDLGQRVGAAVVGTADPVALLAHARHHLAPYKVPRQIAVMPALPRNAMGKVTRSLLRDRLAAMPLLGHRDTGAPPEDP
jgi:malonyl-CoA/methylmalonyl-CoA synthetase